MSSALNAESPPRLSQWLTHSIGWTGGCVAAWVLLAYSLQLTFPGPEADALQASLLFLSFCAAHWTIWQRAISGFEAAALSNSGPAPANGWLDFLAAAWGFALLLFQVGCLLVVPLGILLMFYEGSAQAWQF